MNKKLKLLFNILIVVAALGFLVSLVDLIGSIQYRNREVPDESAETMGVFDYKIKHKAYGEITNTYFTDRMYSMEAPAGIEKTYLVAEYANMAFLKRLYAEKGDSQKEQECLEKLNAIRAQLGDYAFTADELEKIVK